MFQCIHIIHISLVSPDHMDAVLHTEILNALADQKIIIILHFLLGRKPLDDAQGISRFAGGPGLFLIIQGMGNIQNFLTCLRGDVQRGVII